MAETSRSPAGTFQGRHATTTDQFMTHVSRAEVGHGRTLSPYDQLLDVRSFFLQPYFVRLPAQEDQWTTRCDAATFNINATAKTNQLKLQPRSTDSLQLAKINQPTTNQL